MLNKINNMTFKGQEVPMINFVIEKCNERKNPEDEFRRYLLDRVFGRKNKDGNWIIFPNTITYERAVELYTRATK